MAIMTVFRSLTMFTTDGVALVTDCRIVYLSGMIGGLMGPGGTGWSLAAGRSEMAGVAKSFSGGGQCLQLVTGGTLLWVSQSIAAVGNNPVGRMNLSRGRCRSCGAAGIGGTASI